METITYSGELTVVKCWCGIRHAIPSELRREQSRAHDRGGWQGVYCPIGHKHAPAGTSEAERLRERLEREQDRAGRLAAERDQAEASARAYKGAATKARKRAGKGVCPVPGCGRTFQQLGRHMATKHPDYAGK